jgi:hypothetical protein
MATENKTDDRYGLTDDAITSLLKAIKRCADMVESFPGNSSPSAANQHAMTANNLACALESVRGKR